MVLTIKSNVIVAVLPFENLSKNNELDHFALGCSEDLITDLSRFSGLQVISFNSSIKFKSSHEPNSKIFDTLKADFLVKGNFRYFEGKVRINIQLIQAENYNIIWAEKYDEELSSIFMIQDKITERIVGSIQNQINTSILASSRKKSISNLDTYDCWLKGYHELKKGTLENDLKAREYFNQALSIDPYYARAYTGLSPSYFNEWTCQLWDRWEISQKGAFEYARKAIELDDTDAVALTVLGRIHLFQDEFEKAEHYLRKSLKMNPNDADNLIYISSCFVYLGYLDEAEALFLKGIRLNPINNEWYFGMGIFIYYELGQYDKCIEFSKKVQMDTGYIDMSVFVAASYYMRGDMERMNFYWNFFEKEYQKKIIKGKEVNTEEAIQWIKNNSPYKKEGRISSFWDFIGRVKTRNTIFSKPLRDPNSSHSNVFKKGAEVWEISFEGSSILLPEVKGFNDLALLFSTPDKEIHCAQLMGSAFETEDNGSFVLDEKAKNEYQKRVRNLLKEIEEAEDFNDTERAIGLKEEYEKLVSFLSRSLGLNGKSRKTGSQIERSRTAVTWRIRSAIQKIEKAHPQLGRHLSKSVVTGTFCKYSPEKPVDWIL